MTAITPPTKQQIRDQRPNDIPEQDAPPTRDDIRRELGWELLWENRQQDAGDRDPD